MQTNIKADIEISYSPDLTPEGYPWLVTTVMSENWEHWAAEAELRKRFLPGSVAFDSESGQFFAYAETEGIARLLARAIGDLEKHPPINIEVVRRIFLDGDVIEEDVL